MQRPWQHAMTHRHHHLDHTSHTSRGLGVTDVRLHRPKPQRTLAILPIGGDQRLGLDRIAERGARAVGLHHINLAGREPGVGQRLGDHPLLGGTVGRCQPVARAILVDRAASHKRQHLMTIAPSIGEALQQHHAHALRPADAVGRIREGLAAPVGGKTTLAAEPTNPVGEAITVTPPASASEHSPERNAWLAQCNATSEEEQAVSTVTAGPSKPNV